MAKPFLRVGLSGAEADFAPVIVQAGVPLLDKWNNNGALLGTWLGRFVAVAEWEADTVNCYLRDDDGGGLEGIRCSPAAEADLRGELKREFEDLKDRLQKVVPQSTSARNLHQFVCQALADPQPAGDLSGLKCQLFKYRDLQGDWRLVWCPGYALARERASGMPAICGNPECRRLTLVDRTGVRPCPRCGRSIRTRSWISRHRKQVAASLVLLVLAAAAGYVYTRPDATIRGRVVRAIDGRPIAGADVRIAGTSYVATTGSEGAFILRHKRISGRSVAMHVSAPGFRDESVQPELDSGQDTGVEVRLTGAAQLQGAVVHVMGGADKPIPGAQVSLDGLGIPPVNPAADGVFRLEALPPGPVQVRVSAAGFCPTGVDAEATTDAGPALRVVLTGNGKLSGKVVHARDESVPVPAAEVSVEGLESLRAQTDNRGQFAFSNVPPAPVQVWTSAKGYRRIAIVADSLQAPIRIPLAGDATLVGSVTRGDTNEAVRGAEVRLNDTPFRTSTDETGRFRLDGVRSGPVQIVASLPGLSAQLAEDLPANEEKSVAIVLTGAASIRGRVISAADQRPVANAMIAVAKTRLQATTDAQGEFSLTGIPVSTVTLQASAERFVPQAVAKELAEGEQTVGDLALVPAVSVSGRVVRAVDDQPVADAEVAIAEPRVKTRTDEKGQFTFPGVPQVRIQVGVLAKGFRSQVASVDPGSEPVRIALTGDAVLTGSVTRGDTNQPASGAEVVLTGTPFTAKSDAQGHFRLEGVCSGPAQIAASLPGLSASVAKDLPANQETSVQLVLAGGASVRGRVIRAGDGQPVARATVSVPQTQLKTASDDQGQFSLGGVPVGPTTLRVQADDYLPQDVVKELAKGEQAVDDVALQPAATVSGVVVRTLDGNPVADAEVTVGDGQAKARTDRKGAFEILGLPVGPATFRVAAAGYKPQEVPSQLALGRQMLKDVALVGDTPLTGVTRDADDPQRAVPDARVEVRLGGSVKQLASAANGGFTVGDVPSGTVEVTAQAAGYREALVRKEVGPSDARIEVPMTRLITVRGQVVEAGSRRRAVAGANVSISVDGTTQSATTGPDGGFSVSVPPGEAVASASAEGFCDASVEKRLSPKDTSLVIPLVRGTNLRGTVVNAVTGQPLPGATVAVTAGGVTRTGTSGGDGRFDVSGVPAGDAAVAVDAFGFEPASFRASGGDGLRIVLSPEIPEGEARIVLTWSERPRDLDGHLYGPLPGGGQFHVGFKDLQAAGVTLDVDAKEGLGPETITARVSPGTYRYYVAHNDNLGTSEGQGLARSGAQVRVYFKGAPQRPYAVPAGGTGPVWHALDVQVSSGGQISVVPRNQLLRDLPKLP